MSDEERTAYIENRRRTAGRTAASPSAGERSYGHGGSGGQTRKVDAPASWLRSPDSRGGADRRGSSSRDR